MTQDPAPGGKKYISTSLAMKNIILSLSGALLIFGCAAPGGVVQDDMGTFTVTRQSATGLSDIDELRAESMEEARAFCEGRGRAVQVVSERSSEPPYYILADHPEIRIQFMCSDAQASASAAGSR